MLRGTAAKDVARYLRWAILLIPVLLASCGLGEPGIEAGWVIGRTHHPAYTTSEEVCTWRTGQGFDEDGWYNQGTCWSWETRYHDHPDRWTLDLQDCTDVEGRPQHRSVTRYDDCKHGTVEVSQADWQATATGDWWGANEPPPG